MIINYFSTIDILRRKVNLEKKQLYSHIICSSGHTEMAFDLKSMAKTIEDPDYIFESSSHKERDVYFGKGKHKDFKYDYVKVIVDFTDQNEGSVVTSYIKNTVSGNLGRLRYAKSTST